MGSIEKAIYNRSERLLGADTMDLLAEKRVIIFGVGGVGSWCAESLVRSGIKHLTIVDSDRVCITNVNRQIMATMKTIGMVKVEALKERLLSINPKADITAMQRYTRKAQPTNLALRTMTTLSMRLTRCRTKRCLFLTPAARKRNFLVDGRCAENGPNQSGGGRILESEGLPVRCRATPQIQEAAYFPAHKFKCVYSEELLPNLGESHACGTAACLCPKAENGPGDPDLLNHEWCSSKAQINGSLSHITAIFGFTIAGLIMQDATASSAR